MADEFSAWLLRSHQVDVGLKKLKVDFLGDVYFKEVLLSGSKQDTLVYIEDLKLSTSFFRWNHLRSVYVNGLKVNYLFDEDPKTAELYRQMTTYFNISDSSTSIYVKHFWLNGADLNLGTFEAPRSFENIDLYAKESSWSSDVNLVLSHLNWQVEGGANHHLKATKIQISDTAHHVADFSWESGNSLAKFDFNHSSQNDKTTLKLHQFNADYSAVKGMVDAWPEALQFDMSTVIHLEEDSLWTEGISIGSNNGSKVLGSFAVKNASDFAAWEYFFEADTFDVVADEWTWITDLFPNKYSTSPLGGIHSQFTFQGSMADLDLDLILDSDQGSLDADLQIDVSDSLKVPYYKGHLNLRHFNLAKLLPNYEIHRVDADISVKGEGLDFSNFDTDIHGDVNSIKIRDYNYQNVQLDGRLQPYYFKGKASVLDSNLVLDFSGEIDFSQDMPAMDFVADITEADLVQLNWLDNESEANFTSLIEMNIKGDSWSNIEGTIGANFSTLKTQDAYYYFDDIYFSSEKNDDENILLFTSDFIDAKLEGVVEIPSLYPSIVAHLNPHYPLLNRGYESKQDFDFQIQAFQPSEITKILMPSLTIADSTSLFGSFNPHQEGLVLNFESSALQWDKWLGEDLKIQTFVSSDSSQVTCHLASLKNEDQWDLKQVNFSQKGALSDWDYHLAWASEDSLNFDGSLKGSASIDSESIEFDLSESQMYIADTLWTLQNRSFIKADDNDVFADIHLETHSQKFAFEHSGNPDEFVRYIEFTDFELANFTPSLKRFKTSFEGQLNGDFKHVKIDSLNQFYSKIQSDDVNYNHFPMGSLSLNLDYDTENDLQTLLGGFSENEGGDLAITGAYMPLVDTNNFNIHLEVNDFNLRPIETYISVLDTLDGAATGSISSYGELNRPLFSGDFEVDGLRFSVPHLNTQFESTAISLVELTDRNLIFHDLSFHGVESGKRVGFGKFDGQFNHRYFKDFSLDLRLEADSLLCLNTDAYVDKPYYGRALASGDAHFKGPKNAVEMQVYATAKKGSSLYIPLDDDESIDELSFVHFVKRDEGLVDTESTVTELVESKPSFTLDMNVELNENTQVNIIFDETLGDQLKATGNGFINIGINNADEVYMFGDYVVDQGDYLFTLQNFVNKKFEIEQGAKLSWDGSPYEAQMNLNALYKLNTNLSLLTSDTLYNKSRDVECRMLMRGDLLQPDIDFDIQIPKGDDRIKRILDEQTNTEEKNTQQFLSLLVLNSFMSSSEYNDTDVDYLSSTVSSGAEVLNNQLYNWTSQFSDRFDLGLKYHPNQGEYLSQRQWELLLNNMKLNDRITFNGNIASQAENTSQFIGDFEVEYQLSDDGKLRLLAFSNNLEENTQLQVEANKYYTTGLGLFYRDEFDDFRDLWKKFKGMFRRKARK